MSIIDRNRVYNLPASMALALGAERGELVAMAIKQVESKEVAPTQELVVELMALVGNLVSELREAKWKLMRVEEETAELLEVAATMRGDFKRLQRMCNVLDEIVRGDAQEDES